MSKINIPPVKSRAQIEASDNDVQTKARRALVIGIGAGNPDLLTVQAIEGLNNANVLFIPGKGQDKIDLQQFRRDICDRFIRGRNYRLIGFDMPARERRGDYRAGVDDWHDEIATIYERLLIENVTPDECAAFLVWGDPSLYDSTLRILARVAERGAVRLSYEVIPGITSIQVLAAKHKITLNRIGEPVAITTGRKLARTMAAGNDSVIVMLDGQNAFRTVAEDVDIYWGAYLGMPDEILLHGRLSEVGDEIERVRAEARARKGWIMDTYLLRPRETDKSKA